MSFGSFDKLADDIKSNNSTSETYAFNFNNGGKENATLSDSN